MAAGAPIRKTLDLDRAVSLGELLGPPPSAVRADSHLHHALFARKYTLCASRRSFTRVRVCLRTAGVATVCALKHDPSCVRAPLDQKRPYLHPLPHAARFP